MDHDGDKGDDRSEDSSPEREGHDRPGYQRAAFMGRALKAVIAIIAVGAAAASIPYWGSADFPVTSLIVYVAGMVFVAMPLCMYYEVLLKVHEERVASAMS
ncbi:hypothetical protein [Variovorax sp. MHTC-1]|uniref:hypothetical protein n=1 Tax=Variovorax sp. MHTC-1 TaxID=2495593 RepID=UPI000F86681C|nr:hypothetical protein [Variovorax sp. MHTC-1]RST56044.1 hypothetical protein EJI01_04590 [Variovorax sp. MHTC-1]